MMFSKMDQIFDTKTFYRTIAAQSGRCGWRYYGNHGAQADPERTGSSPASATRPHTKTSRSPDLPVRPRDL
jgi:hypothetical protein